MKSIDCRYLIQVILAKFITASTEKSTRQYISQILEIVMEVYSELLLEIKKKKQIT